MSLEEFANIAKDVADLTEVLRDHMKLDATQSLEARVEAAAIT